MDAFVAHHLQGVSRTYALLIPMLPSGLADAVGLAYLLMRIVDTIEDAPQLTDEQRMACFAELEQALASPDLAAIGRTISSTRAGARVVAAARRERDREGRASDSQNAGDAADTTGATTLNKTVQRGLGDLAAEHVLMQHIPEVIDRVHALTREYQAAAIHCANQMMTGVRMMMGRSRQRGVPYPGNRDAAELREYCHYVAGVVGEMLCAMMSHYLRMPSLNSLRGVAIELGIGLQLVNILKDSLRDASGGRRYLPLADGKVAPGEMYKLALEEARASLKRGAEFVLALPAAARELRCFCGLPIAWGAMTLARAERDAGAAKITRTAIQSSIDLFKRLVGDDNALRGWLSSMLRPTPV